MRCNQQQARNKFTDMPFNPNLPQTNSPISSEELRNQFTGLNELIDQRITEETLNQTVDNLTKRVQERIDAQTAGECSGVGSLNFSASDPPTQGAETPEGLPVYSAQRPRTPTP